MWSSSAAPPIIASPSPACCAPSANAPHPPWRRIFWRTCAGTRRRDWNSTPWWRAGMENPRWSSMARLSLCCKLGLPLPFGDRAGRGPPRNSMALPPTPSDALGVTKGIKHALGFLILALVALADDTPDLLKASQEKFSHGDYRGAMLLLDQIVLQNPRNPAGYFLRSITKDKLSDAIG